MSEQSNHQFDVTALITAHGEGLIADSSIHSMKKAVDLARAAGVTVEIMAMLDRPDDLTAECFEHNRKIVPDISIHQVDFGDAGFSRNHGASLARGKYIALLDADDLWMESWVVEAFMAAENDSREIVWHPHVNVYHGMESHVFMHIDMEDPLYDSSVLAYTNPWTSLSFARTDLFRRVPYTGTDLKNGIGYEDWSWNIDVMKEGAIHKVIPGTAHMIRQKPVSLVRRTNASNCIPRPTDFLKNKMIRSSPDNQ